MRLISYTGGFGRLEGDIVVPLGSDIRAYLATGAATEGASVPMASLRRLAPVPTPGKIVAVGLNYREHAAETGTPVPDEPSLFAKFGNSVIGDGEPIHVPALTREPDWEAELGIVIGRRASGVRITDALEHVAGYMCVNDVSARDLQHRTTQWLRGKAIDTFMPCGPWLVTADEVPDPQTLGIRSLLNAEPMQSSTTADMIWTVAELIAYVSETLSLEPGDVMLTGTPPGVGCARKPPRYLQDGDAITIEIDQVGAITNPVVRPESGR